MSAPADRPPAPAGSKAFSRPIRVDDVPDDGLARTIEADRGECEAIAAEIGLPAVRKLVARYDITRQPGRRLRVEGLVEATITQNCVVSLEPFDSDLTQPVDLTFAPAPTPSRAPGRRASLTSRRREKADAPAPVRVVEGEEDPPDEIIDGRIDLGTVAVEFLTLALDFYPRKPGVHFSDVVGETGEERPAAFAALARLKDRS